HEHAVLQRQFDNPIHHRFNEISDFRRIWWYRGRHSEIPDSQRPTSRTASRDRAPWEWEVGGWELAPGGRLQVWRKPMALGLCGSALIASPSTAHHAVQAVFDLNKPVSVTGTVTSIEWTNPHSYIMLDARGDKGVVQHWTFELPGPGTLRHSGLNPE